MADARTPIIVGPTAIGKTAVALALASHWPLEVISADSRQVYIGLDVATAKPTARERERVRHHLLDRIKPGDRYSAGRFSRDASLVVHDVRARGVMPVVVGGTGLYVRAFVEGLFREPPMAEDRRAGLARITAMMDHATLVRWAGRLDPEFAGGGGKHRAARAIEVALLTGRPLSWWQESAAGHGAVRPWFVRLTAPRPVLHQRIRARTEELVRRGLVEEVAAALADGAPAEGPGLDAIGVREAVAVLHGRLPRDLLVDAIATATRQYAKRQETWFRHQLGADVLTLDATRSPEQVAGAIAAAWEQRSA
ncbi:MAG TPA: tRNA (adenosine(37)-N6)-dimethylallyltransferase MiaA [Gemmatimonadales bacterium]|nr:tRNA (adenosine(37)-N6)-dimethylallyltransferase MiaA [Gemmatimonadales bacterium]